MMSGCMCVYIYIRINHPSPPPTAPHTTQIPHPPSTITPRTTTNDPQGGKTFNYVFDNFAKNVDLAKPVAELAKAQKWPVKTYVFVSSGASFL